MRFIKKIQYNAPVILSFTLISFLALLINLLTNGSSNYYLFSIYRSAPSDPLLYIRLFGHVLGHVSMEHFFGNFVLILLAGPILEEKYGSKSILIMILFTSVITGVAHLILSPDAALLGASGVVFMFILLSSFVSLQKGKIPLTLILCILVFIGREVANGLLSQDNISYITHIIGGVCGAFFGFRFNKDKLLSNS